DVEIWRLHYAPTLRAWRERFLTHRHDAARIYDERFCRMWEYYLSMGETAFQFEDVVVFQIQLAKTLDAVPITRDYIADRKATLRTAETSIDARKTAQLSEGGLHSSNSRHEASYNASR